MSTLPSYARLMADAAFHVSNARRLLESAQAKAPEEDLAWLDKAIAGAESLRRQTRNLSHEAAQRGGLAAGPRP